MVSTITKFLFIYIPKLTVFKFPNPPEINDNSQSLPTAEKPCNDCLNSFDFKNADTIAAVHAAESSINYLLEQDIMGAANIPDYIPATENYVSRSDSVLLLYDTLFI